MKITDLIIKNFGPITEAHLGLDGRGLTNIEGVNMDDPSADSNGSGKSTIPDALYWALFGETARGVSGDDVVNNAIGANCSVSVWIEDGDDKYIVQRLRKFKAKGVKPNGLILEHIDTTTGTATDLTKGTDKLTQVEVERILGCSKEVFTKAVYSGQESLPDLPSLTDKQIKELVEEAAGIELLSRAHELAKKHRLDVGKENENAIRDLAEADRGFTDAQAQETHLTGLYSGWGSLQADKISRIEDDWTKAMETVRELIDERGTASKADLKAGRDKLQASVSEVSLEAATLRKFEAAVSSASKNEAAVNTRLSMKMVEAKKARTHYDSFESQVGKPCSECGKAYAAEDIAGAKELARVRLNEIVAEAKVLAGEQTAAKDAIKAAEEARDKFKASMTDVSATMIEIKALDLKIEALERMDRAIATKEAEKANFEHILAAVKTETNPYGEMLSTARVKLAEKIKARDVARIALDATQKKTEIAQAAVNAFGPTGVRAYVLDTVTPFLNSRTAHYLGTLSDGRISAIWTTLATNSKGELVEKFCIEVQKDGTGGKTFKALSGGEKRKVRLSCALALQDLVASRATKPIGLWIGDEVDDALDSSGLERLMAVLEEKAREKGTVLIISHNSLSDYIRETTTVTMEGGTSTVSGSLV